jgi:hypothetical protein
MVRLRFHQTDPNLDGCDISPCALVSSRVTVEFDCEDFLGVEDEAFVQKSIIDQIGNAIENQTGLSMAWTEISGVGLNIQSLFPLSGWLCGQEVGVSCGENQAFPLSGCAVYNLCDGVDANQTADASGFLGGLSLELIHGPCPPVTHLPTLTPTQTRTPAPPATPTETSTCPLHLNMGEHPFTVDELLGVLSAGKSDDSSSDLNCDGEFDHRDVFLFVRFWRQE